METPRIALTSAQKGLLAALSRETGEPVAALLDKVLADLQEHVRMPRVNGEQQRPQPAEAPKPIWEVFADTQDIPEEAWEQVPTDLATQHDHYMYQTPKRQV